MAVARLRAAASARLQPALAAGGRGERRPLGTAAEVATATGPGAARWELMGAREYYDYRKSIYGDVTHRALLVDAVGTLVVPAQPTAQVSTVARRRTSFPSPSQPVPLLSVLPARCVPVR